MYMYVGRRKGRKEERKIGKRRPSVGTYVGYIHALVRCGANMRPYLRETWVYAVACVPGLDCGETKV